MESSSTSSVRERREFPRIRLKAYGFDHYADMEFNGNVHRVSLVDISPGGARLGRINGSNQCTAKPGDQLRIKLISINSQSDVPKFIICQVRWRDKDELGVQFQPQLDISVGELQKLLAT